LKQEELTFKEKAGRRTLKLRFHILFNQSDIDLIDKDVVKIYERCIGQVLTLAGKVNNLPVKEVRVRRHVYVAY
jgi:hypothetical protein